MWQTLWNAKLSHVIYVSFILKAGGCPRTDSPQVILIGVIKLMTSQEILNMDKDIYQCTVYGLSVFKRHLRYFHKDNVYLQYNAT